MSDGPPQASRCYRIGRHYLISGVVGAAFFPAVGISSVYAAYWNIDGSFPHPKIHALVHGIFWSGWSVLAVWLIAAYFRVRISITDGAITKQGVFLKHHLLLTDISQVTWKGIPQSGKVILHSSESRVKIDLSDLSQINRTELIRTIRDVCDPALQSGWERFSRLIPSGPAPTPADARRTAKVCGLLFFGFGVVSIACGWFEMGVQFYAIGDASFVVTCWYVWRIRRHKRQTAG